MSIFKLLAAAGIIVSFVSMAAAPALAETDARAALGASLTALMVAERAGLAAAVPSAAQVEDAGSDAVVSRGDTDGGTRLVSAPTSSDVTPSSRGGWFAKRTSRAAPTSDRFDLAWLLAQPTPSRTAELDCLATALYFEARGEGPDGQAAVAEVILNRTGLPGFPRSVCEVVRDGAGDGAGGCQFSYACDGRSDVVTDRTSYAIAQRIAAAMMAGAPRSLTDGATHFHNDSVRPSWAARFARTARIGEHTFYRMPIRTASN